jgi:hypothetical protein
MGEMEGRYTRQWYSLSLLKRGREVKNHRSIYNSFLRFLSLVSLIANKKTVL